MKTVLSYFLCVSSVTCFVPTNIAHLYVVCSVHLSASQFNMAFEAEMTVYYLVFYFMIGLCAVR